MLKLFIHPCKTATNTDIPTHSIKIKSTNYKYQQCINIIKYFDFLFIKHLYHLPVKPKSFQQNHRQKMTSSMIKSYNLIFKDTIQPN